MKKTSISIAIGIGDHIVIRGYLDTIKHEYDEIKISNHKAILQEWRNNDPVYSKFIDQFGTLLFSEAPYKFDSTPYRYLSQWDIIKDYKINPQKPNLSYLLCKGEPLNLNEPYIVLTTKVRFVDKRGLYPVLPRLWRTLNELSKKYKLVILGEREVERSKEYSVLNNFMEVHCLYDNIISNISKERILDLTVPALGITTPSFDNIRQDCLIMNQAKCVIVVGVGGNFCMSSAVANTIGYRADKEPNLDLMLKNNYSDLFMTRDWEQFINKLESL
jgi:hypothetical protein